MYILSILIFITFVLIGIQQLALHQHTQELNQLRNQLDFFQKHAFPQFCGMCGRQRYDDVPKCHHCGHAFEQPANEAP